MYTKQALSQPSGGPLPRVDLILEIYDRLLERLSLARDLVSARPAEAKQALTQCQIAVSSLAMALDGRADELSANMVRLYEFVGHCIEQETPARLQDACEVLSALREGFQAARQEAVDMERCGAIPALSTPQFVATA